MSSRNRIPSALEPYLRLPPETSLVLLTSTLGCSANWLTARFVGSLLAQEAEPLKLESSGNGKETAVVLVSWMRDAAFWKSEIRRGIVSDKTYKISGISGIIESNADSSLGCRCPEAICDRTLYVRRLPE